MNPVLVVFLALAAMIVTGGVALAETNCTTTCQTVWGQTVCKTRCD
jgi:hypothetical protein